MKIMRKIAAAALAAILAASLCGCMDNGRLMTIEGMEIRNGVYLYFQQTAYAEAQSKINEALAPASSSEESSSEDEESSSSSSSIIYFDQSVEGKSTAQWVNDETMRLVRQFVAIHKLCDEAGISLDAADTDDINDAIKKIWDGALYDGVTMGLIDYTTFFRLMNEGYNTVGDYYESMGIARESMNQIYIANTLKDKLFEKHYGKDGKEPVSDETLNSYLKENFAAIKLVEFPYTDYSGTPLVLDKDKKDVTDLAEEYAEKFNAGSTGFIDIKYETDLKKKQDEARYQAELYYAENPVEGKTSEEYVEEEVAKITADKAESEDDLISVVRKDYNTLDKDIADIIFGAPADGKASVQKTEDSAVLIVRTDILAQEKWITDNRANILSAMKGNDFEVYLEEVSRGYKIDKNDYLVNEKYKPEKLEQSSSSTKK